MKVFLTFLSAAVLYALTEAIISDSTEKNGEFPILQQPDLRLSRRTDSSSKSPFHTQEEIYKDIQQQITDQIEELAAIPNGNDDIFTKFRSLKASHEEKFEELCFMAQEIPYKQADLQDRLMDLQSIFHMFNQGNKYNVLCSQEGQWIDCLITELYELRLTFINIYGDFDDCRGQEIECSKRLAVAQSKLVEIGQKGRILRSNFKERWIHFAEAVVASKDFLVDLQLQSELYQ